MGKGLYNEHAYLASLGLKDLVTMIPMPIFDSATAKWTDFYSFQVVQLSKVHFRLLSGIA